MLLLGELVYAVLVEPRVNEGRVVEREAVGLLASNSNIHHR